jgi:hypothetical protein
VALAHPVARLPDRHAADFKPAPKPGHLSTERITMSKITVLSDTDLDAVTGAGWGNYNKVVYSGNGGTAISGVATGNISTGYYGSVYIDNYVTGSASANGNVTISN